MTSPDPPDTLPETIAAERLRQHLEEIARERDRAHRALQEREAELARIQRMARVGGLEIDFRDGVRNRRSPEYLLVHGLTEDAVNETYGDWVSRIHPDDRERTVKHLFGVLRGVSPDYSAEYRIIRPTDGDIRWIRVVAKIERNRDGRAQRLVGADLDVTDQMLAQETLRESEERFRLIADSAPVPIWVTKLDRTALFRQPGLSRLPWPTVRAGHRVRLAQGAASGRPAAHPAGTGRRRGFAASRSCWRRATGAQTANGAGCGRIATAPGPDRQAYRLHRRRPRHHRRQSGRERFAAAERNAGTAHPERTAQLQSNEAQMRAIFETSHQYQALLNLRRRRAVRQQDGAGRHPRRRRRRHRQAVLGNAMVQRDERHARRGS